MENETIIALYCIRRKVQYFTVPSASIAEMLQNIAAQIPIKREDRPFAVDIHINDEIVLPSEEHKQFAPPLGTRIVFLQNCSGDATRLPNLAWRFE